MQKIDSFLIWLNQYLGGHQWFVFFLLGTGIFFTFYLKFPQIRYFGLALKIVRGKYDKETDIGDTSHFQALATALSGTVGTGNIAGVALAIHLGGPAALFWMLVTAMVGMCTKFVEVTLSHKYRDILPNGRVSGGPMYYMRKRLNIKAPSGKIIKTGVWLGAFFAFATILSTFGTGSLPQINSISNAIYQTFRIDKIITGAILSILLALIIIGGIKRIAKVTSTLVPFMAVLYFLGAVFVIITNYDNIIPSFLSVFTNVFTGSAATGGFLGAGFAFSFNKGVNRGLFSNEAGQGSAPIAHASARAHEPVSEGMVAILEPFIDTIIICFLTGLVLLTSGVWNEKFENEFENADIQILSGFYPEKTAEDKLVLNRHLMGKKPLELFTGELNVSNGKIQENFTILHARSVAEDIVVYSGKMPYSGKLMVSKGKPERGSFSEITIEGKSLIHSAPLTTEAFNRSFIGNYGRYINTIGLLLFAFSTAISWAYYGEQAVTYLFGLKFIIWYKIIFIVTFFIASFTDTTIVWNLSYITIALMTIPNLLGLWLLRKEVKTTIREYFIDFLVNWPDAKLPPGEKNN